jgi:hypothetical protein
MRRAFLAYIALCAVLFAGWQVSRAATDIGLTTMGVTYYAPSGGGSVTWTTFTPPAIQAGTANPQAFTGVSIGTAASNRVVVVCVGASNNTPVTSVTIGGVSATAAEQSGGSANAAELWYASVPSGTTATFDINLAAGFPTNIGIIVGALTTTTPTPGTGALQASTLFNNDPQETTTAITVPSNGIGIVCGDTGTPNASPTYNNWTADQQVTISAGTPEQWLLGHVGTGSQTPSISGYAFSSFGIAAAPWGP